MMPYIRTIPPDEATGELKEDYDAAVARAGRVFKIIEAMSLRPRLLRAFVAFAVEILTGPAALSEEDRRRLAYVVSETNRSGYSMGVYRSSEGLDEALRDFAVKLTREPASMTEEDIERLRERGYTDEAIHDAVQVIALLNYGNRIADGLGIENEPAGL
jgi:alkylhydroperoxidase family enzyme